MIEVATLTAATESAYRDFVARAPGALLYHSLAYRDLLVEHLGCRQEYLVAREGGEVRGVLPLLWTGDERARVYNSLPFYGSHGSVISESDAAASRAHRRLRRARDRPGNAGGDHGGQPVPRRPAARPGA